MTCGQQGVLGEVGLEFMAQFTAHYGDLVMLTA
jgi:hypothetical protein